MTCGLYLFLPLAAFFADSLAASTGPRLDLALLILAAFGVLMSLEVFAALPRLLEPEKSVGSSGSPAGSWTSAL